MSGPYGGFPYGGGAGAVLPTPPIPIPFASSPQAVVWTFAQADGSGGPLTHALQPSGPVTLTFDLDGHPELSANVHGHSVYGLEDWASDVVATRNGRRLFRGYAVVTDTIDPDTHQVQVRAYGYRHRLHRRLVQSQLVLDGMDEEAVRWSLIDHAQGQTGGHMGIVRDGTPTGVTRDRTYEPGDNVGQRADELGRVVNGGDWEIDGDLTYRAWAARGVRSPIVLWHGSTVDTVVRQPSPTYANSVRATGDDTTTPVVATDVPAGPTGRWDTPVASPNTSRQSTVQERADGELAERSRVPVEWTVTLSDPAVWSPDRLWVGDTARLVVKSGRVDVDTDLRVVRIQVTVDPSAGERVVVGLDAIPTDLPDLWARLTSRVADLESA